MDGTVGQRRQRQALGDPRQPRRPHRRRVRFRADREQPAPTPIAAGPTTGAPSPRRHVLHNHANPSVRNGVLMARFVRRNRVGKGLLVRRSRGPWSPEYFRGRNRHPEADQAGPSCGVKSAESVTPEFLHVESQESQSGVHCFGIRLSADSMALFGGKLFDVQALLVCPNSALVFDRIAGPV